MFQYMDTKSYKFQKHTTCLFAKYVNPNPHSNWKQCTQFTAILHVLLYQALHLWCRDIARQWPWQVPASVVQLDSYIIKAEKCRVSCGFLSKSAGG